MIVRCPGCKKQISSKAALCPNCGFERDEISHDQAQELERRRLRDRLYHLNMASYGVISLFLAAFGWYWWSTAGFKQPSAAGPVALLGVGMIAYVVIRVLLFMAKRDVKKLKRA